VPSDIEKFDLVTAFEILYYMPSPREILEKLQSLLRPGGRIIVAMSANRGWLIWLLSWIKGSPMELSKKKWITSVLLNGRAYYAFSSESVIRLLKSAGFTDTRMVRLKTAPPKRLRFRIPLCIWYVLVSALWTVTFGKVDLDTKVHVIAQYVSRSNRVKNALNSYVA
jgi:SAM-dependent methyltransferase